MALALGEDGDEHIGAGHFLAAGGLHMDHGALDHALEACRGLGVFASIGDEVFKLALDIIDEALFQGVRIDRAGAHDSRGVGVVKQAEQQMLQRRIFVTALIGDGQSAMERLFQITRERRHRSSHPLRSRFHCKGCERSRPGPHPPSTSRLALHLDPALATRRRKALLGQDPDDTLWPEYGNGLSLAAFTQHPLRHRFAPITFSP